MGLMYGRHSIASESEWVQEKQLSQKSTFFFAGFFGKSACVINWRKYFYVAVLSKWTSWLRPAGSDFTWLLMAISKQI